MKKIFIENTKHFDLEQTFECGQCFRWNRQKQGEYVGVAGDYLIKARYVRDGIEIECANERFAAEYFDIEKTMTQ